MSYLIDTLLQSATSSGSDANCIGFIRRDLQTALTPLLASLSNHPEIAARIRELITTDEFARAIFMVTTTSGDKNELICRTLQRFLHPVIDTLDTATFPNIPRVSYQIRELWIYGTNLDLIISRR